MASEANTADLLEAHAPPPRPREIIYRHSLVVRLTHWLNVLAVSLLLMSGLNIFNAHPQLYWGAYGADFDRAWLEAVPLHPGNPTSPGVFRVGDLTLKTTGVLGVSKGPHGERLEQGFPWWTTLPSWRDLATARRWHFFLAWILVANGLVYIVMGLINGHLKRDLAPTRKDLAPANLVQSVIDHIKLKHPVGEAAKRYNVLQKMAYVGVALIVLPLVVATGLTMSPGFDAIAPWLLDLFGGRQSARSIHFICANLIVLFVIVHVVEVFLAGVVNEIGSMITGRYVVPQETH
jgi:thiosulfate reductase cytochrome b subunit